MGIGVISPERTPTGASAATGGTVTTSGAYTIHTFASGGNLVLSAGLEIDYLIVAGGGGGGKDYGGGGGAGGVLSGSATLAAGTFAITVGSAGAGGSGGAGANGGNSTFNSLTAIGGGGGAGGSTGSAQAGGSGGGGSFSYSSGGSGTSGQGNAGGAGTYSSNAYRAGGGGGVSAAGGTGTAGSASGAGGAGVSSSITGTATVYGSGGGGGGYSGYSIAGGAGGTGAGSGGYTDTQAGGNATGYGCGGGGGAGNQGNGGDGFQGVVIIRYLTPAGSDTTTVTSAAPLSIDYTPDRPVKAEVYSQYDARKLWNGTAWVLYSSLADAAAWRACLITVSEALLADGTHTGHYHQTLPAAVQRHPWAARFYAAATPNPTDTPIGTQSGRTHSDTIVLDPWADPESE